MRVGECILACLSTRLGDSLHLAIIIIMAAIIIMHNSLFLILPAIISGLRSLLCAKTAINKEWKS